MAELKNIAGLKELQDALQKLPENIAKNVLRGAVNAGAAIIRDEAKLKAPILHDAIPEKSGPTQQTYFVTVRKGKKLQGQGKKGNKSQDAYYASWVEFGHWINTTGRAIGGGRGKDAKRAAAVAAGHNKYVAAHPYMRPAYEAKKFDAVEAIKAYLQKRIPKEVEKLRH